MCLYRICHFHGIYYCNNLLLICYLNNPFINYTICIIQSSETIIDI